LKDANRKIRAKRTDTTGRKKRKTAARVTEAFSTVV
jgi:hypothetical protein